MRYQLQYPLLWRGEGGFLARTPWDVLAFWKDNERGE
jgi:hypothetical protein